MEPAGTPVYRYDAFISYRHVEPDRRWAKWLHAALERYRTPRSLVAEGGVSARLTRVFRDEDEVPASPNLGQEIETALRESRFLIVVCSPRTPASRWIDREILTFRELGRGDQILALLIEGNPREAFPAPLREIRRRVESLDGTRHESVEEVEPLAADVRATRVESRKWLRRRAQLRVLAALLGCRFDDLMRRDEARRRRAVLVRTIALSLVVLILALTTAYALTKRSEAEAQKQAADREAEHARAAEYVASINLADALIAQGQYSQARSVLDRTAPSRRRFEYFHLRSRVEPTTAEWRLPEPALDVLDANEDGVPERVVTASGLRSLEGEVARWPLPAETAGFAGRGRWSWALHVQEDRQKSVLLVRDDVGGKVETVDLGAEEWPRMVGGSHLRDQLAIALHARDSFRLLEYDLAARRVTKDVALAELDGVRTVRPGHRERTWILAPQPGGTMDHAVHPRRVDFVDGEVLEIDAGSAVVGPGNIGCHCAAELSTDRVAFSLDGRLGLYRRLETDDPPFLQAALEETPYHVGGLVEDPARNGFVAWDDGGNVRWYRTYEDGFAIHLVVSLGCRGQISCIAPSPSGAWTFVGDDAGGVVAVPHRPWPASDPGSEPPQGAFFVARGSTFNFGWNAFLTVQTDPPCIEEIEVERGSEEERWQARVHRWAFASGRWQEEVDLAFPDHELLLRYSGTERGVEDLAEVLALPRLEKIPLWLPTERRWVLVRADPDATGYAVSSNARFVALQRGQRASLSRVEGEALLSLGAVTLPPGDALAGIDGIGRYVATWNAEKKDLAIHEWASGRRLHQLRIADEPQWRRGHGVAFTPEGDRFASWVDGSTIGMFDTSSGKRLLGLRCHSTYPGGDVRISPDGALLWTKRSWRSSGMGRESLPLVWAAATPQQMALRAKAAR